MTTEGGFNSRTICQWHMRTKLDVRQNKHGRNRLSVLTEFAQRQFENSWTSWIKTFANNDYIFSNVCETRPASLPFLIKMSLCYNKLKPVGGFLRIPEDMALTFCCVRSGHKDHKPARSMPESSQEAASLVVSPPFHCLFNVSVSIRIIEFLIPRGISLPCYIMGIDQKSLEESKKMWASGRTVPNTRPRDPSLPHAGWILDPFLWP